MVNFQVLMVGHNLPSIKEITFFLEQSLRINELVYKKYVSAKIVECKMGLNYLHIGTWL